MTKAIDLSRKTVDYILIIGIILIFALGTFAVYNNFKYLHELTTGPCKLCTDMGYWCTEPYKSKMKLLIPDELLNGTEIYSKLGKN